MSAAGALRCQVQATRRPSGDSAARPMAGRARRASRKLSAISCQPSARKRNKAESGKLTADSSLKLRALYDHRLVLGGGQPFLQRRKRPYRVGIGLRLGLELDLVGAEATHHRRVHRVGDGEATEEEGAARAEALA